MKSKVKQSSKDHPKKVDVYSAQFEYYDLFERLSKIKKERQAKNISMFHSFDLTWVPTHSSSNGPKKRRPNIENIKTVKGSLKTHLESCKNTAKPTHRRNFTDQFLQSELIPLLTPGFNIYYKNKSSKRRKSVEVY
jgi:hypothetical protein